MSYTLDTAPLTKTDRRKLRRNVIGGSVFFVIVTVIFGVIGYNIVGSGPVDVGFYIFLGFGLFFYGIIAYIIGGSAVDLRSGKKELITGKVTNKEVHASKSKKGSTRYSYYLYFDKKRKYVSQDHYNQAMVGDTITLHYGKWSKTSFAVEVIKSGSKEQIEQPVKDFKGTLEKFRSERKALKSSDVPLNSQDLKKLRQTRNKKIGINAFLLVFFLVMTAGFGIGSTLEAFMIIPMLIFATIMYFCLRAIFKCFKKYNLDKAAGVKSAVLSHVKDKYFGNKSGYVIRTAQGSFNVKQQEYDRFAIDSPVISLHGKHSGWLIRLSTPDGEL